MLTAVGVRATLQGYDVRPPIRRTTSGYILVTPPRPAYVIRYPTLSAEKGPVPRPPYTTSTVTYFSI